MGILRDAARDFKSSMIVDTIVVLPISLMTTINYAQNLERITYPLLACHVCKEDCPREYLNETTSEIVGHSVSSSQNQENAFLQHGNEPVRSSGILTSLPRFFSDDATHSVVV